MNIKELRGKTRYSRREFGERLGLTAAAIQKYEDDRGKPSEPVKKLIRFVYAEYFDEQPETVKNPEKGAAVQSSGNEAFLNKLVEQKDKLIAQMEKNGALQEKVIEQLEARVKHYERMIKDAGLTIDGNDNSKAAAS